MTLTRKKSMSGYCHISGNVNACQVNVLLLISTRKFFLRLLLDPSSIFVYTTWVYIHSKPKIGNKKWRKSLPNAKYMNAWIQSFRNKFDSATRNRLGPVFHLPAVLKCKQEQTKKRKREDKTMVLHMIKEGW